MANEGTMKFTITLPGWDWLQKLIERWHPGLADRGQIHGKASENRRFLHGVVDVTLTAERDDPPK